ncbi:hypothetical protein QFZ24_002874 [Streptomyces phaeochromogenes]|jgi:hypothetical protein|uniref:DUF4349 domain-containing protein n=1 Tax=Streptomyces phaeochromogenes TaxID=1923 RepID=UPI00278F7A66|nr:DUF4349 domain-containing protein [Streptomyces phaeochromogenes]MDQ0948951.1 hypothetical protein [Streptomyces phaeochromogenes]
MQTRGSGTTRHRSARPVQILSALALAAALALTGCTGAADDGGASSSGDKAAAPGANEAGAGAADSDASGGKNEQAAAPPKLTAHIIHTASLTVQVKDVPKSLDETRTVVENAGGMVGNETTDRDSEGRERSRVVLRVPSDEYEEVLTELEGSGKLIDRRAKAEDVTEQVVDVESRIKSQRASVVRIRELMDQATKLSDVVTLEGELSTRQADLESLLAQQASLKDRTSLATITLSLSETPVKKVVEDDDPGFADALGGGWDAFVTMFRWIALALGAVLPFLVGAALLLFLWVRFLRGRTPARPVAAAPSGAGAGTGSLPVAPPIRGEGDDKD